MQPVPPPAPKGLLGFAAGLGVAVLLFLIGSGWGANAFYGWERLGVPGMGEPFFDLRTGVAAWRYLQAGHDPYTDGSYSPFGILANYPPLLLHLMGYWSTLPGGTLTCGCMLGGLAVAVFGGLSRPLPAWAGMGVGLSLGLGSCALAFERGNSDLLLIPLLALATWLPLRLEQRGRVWTSALAFAGLLLLGTVLKLLPIAALGAALAFDQPSQRRRALALALVALIVYVAADFAFLARLVQNTPHSYRNSYGTQTLALFLTRDTSPLPLLTGSLTLTLLILAIATFARLRRQTAQAHTGLAYALALAGAGIFAASYVTSASYGYRLIFLALCLPWLLGRRERAWQAAGGLAILFMVWPALEAWIRIYLLWGKTVEAALFFTRQALGLGLAGLAWGWLLHEAYGRLLLKPAEPIDPQPIPA